MFAVRGPGGNSPQDQRVEWLVPQAVPFPVAVVMLIACKGISCFLDDIGVYAARQRFCAD
jgi:hypothetical protein